MNTLKMMFGGGADVAQLAEMIRRFGRGEDKILAHITPEEAAKLKEMGGSGTINPMTGLPEFQEELYDYGPMQSPDTDYRAQMLAAEDPGYYGTSQTGYNQALERADAGATDAQLSDRERYDLQFGTNPMFQYTGNVGGLADRVEPFTQAGREASDIGFGPGQYTPPVSRGELTGASQADLESRFPGAFEEPGLLRSAENRLDELNALLNRYPRLTRIGGAGVNVIGQALLARRATRQREAQAAAERARAVPFRQAEAEAMARARGGGLTPQQARALEVQQARARQGLSGRNQGTGSAAAGILAGQEQRTRSLARQESFDEALKLAGIADQYERRAIAAELAADQELAALFGNVLAQEIAASTRTQAPQRRA